MSESTTADNSAQRAPEILVAAEPYERLGQPRVLVRNVFWNFLGQGWLMALMVVTTPIIVHRLGDALYGIFSVLLTLLVYFWFLGRALGNALVKHMSDSLARRDIDGERCLIRSACFVVGVLALTGALIQLALARWFALRLFHIPPQLLEVATTAFMLGAGVFAFRIVSDLFEYMLHARQAFDVSNQVTIIMQTIQKLLIVAALVWLGWSLRGVLVLLMVLGGAQMGWFYVRARRMVPSGSLVPRPPSGPALGLLVKLALTLAVSALLAIISTTADKLLLGILSPIEEMTYYMVAFNLASMVLMIPGNLLSTLRAAVSESDALGDTAQVQRFLVGGTRCIMAVILPLACLLLVFADRILLHWMGEPFAQRSTLVLQLLALGVIPPTIGCTSLVVAQSTKRPDIPVWVHGFQAALNVGFCWLLIPRFGINGAAVAWCVNQLAGNLVMVHWINAAVVKISDLEFIRRGLLRPLAWTPALGILALCLRPLTVSLPGLLLACAVFLALSGAATYASILNERERGQIRAFVISRGSLKAA